MYTVMYTDIVPHSSDAIITLPILLMRQTHHLVEQRWPSQPVLNDPNLRLELVSEGLNLPSQMAFIGPNDILVLEKDTGMVKRIVNGVILEEPVLDVNVATAYERGLLGIAIGENGSE